jgi:hypothetical protein
MPSHAYGHHLQPATTCDKLRESNLQGSRCGSWREGVRRWWQGNQRRTSLLAVLCHARHPTLARAWALTAVSHWLAQGRQRQEQTGRQQLHAWYDDTPRQRSTKRQALHGETCVPLSFPKN